MTANKTETYLVAGSKPWNRRVFYRVIKTYPGVWRFVGQEEALNLDYLADLRPRYIFFLHWSAHVPDEIIKTYECVCFHMTDVPYGRGGSPLQNLIVRGHKHTKLTALKMVAEFDAGPVYLKEDLCIHDGSAEAVYLSATEKSAEMIRRIITEEIKPVEQEGTPVIFARRRPEESGMPDFDDLDKLYDFIRMLDARGYKKASFDRNGLRFEFSRAVRYADHVIADVRVSPVKEEEGP